MLSTNPESTITTPQHEVKVNFVIAGVQKGGTKALRHFLAQHPMIGFSRADQRTEPHFFDWILANHEHPPPVSVYDSYHRMFDSAALAKVTGDVTPNYIFDKNALSRVQQYNPNMKIIVLLRNPVDRAYSQWNMQVETGRETRGFLMALVHEYRVRRSIGQHRNFSYVQRGFYDSQIARLQRLFPPHNCLILRTESLRSHHQKTLDEVLHFLGLPTMDTASPETIHSREYRPLYPIIRRSLSRLFRRDIRRLERRLGWDLSEWIG